MKIKILSIIAMILITSTALGVTSYRLYHQARDYDFEMCLAYYANICINARCLTDEHRDCPDRCRTQAYAKCVTEQ